MRRPVDLRFLSATRQLTVLLFTFIIIRCSFKHSNITPPCKESHHTLLTNSKLSFSLMMKFRKAARYILLVIMMLLALAGIPLVSPRRIEMDDDDEIKTEIPKDEEQSGKT
jgi:hypothetical protein